MLNKDTTYKIIKNLEKQLDIYRSKEMTMDEFVEVFGGKPRAKLWYGNLGFNIDIELALWWERRYNTIYDFE